MGATNCPETPRQRMIGMMYLFYTALLALNVSNEVINAFVSVNSSMETTTKNFVEKTVASYSAIDKAYAGQPDKFKPTWDQAQQIKAKSDSLFNYIQNLKIEIMSSSQGEPVTVVSTDLKLDNLEAAPQIMTTPGGPQKGVVLKKMMDDYRNFMLGFIDTLDNHQKPNPKAIITYHNVNSCLLTPAKESKEASERRTWEASLCQGMPMIGTITLLTKLQADIRNAEADMIAYLNDKVTAFDIRISRLTALVNAKSSYVQSGGKYIASIFIGAQDTTMRPTVWLTTQAPYYDSVQVGGLWEYKKKDGLSYDTLPLDQFGAGTYELQPGVGDYAYGGLIQYKSNVGMMWLPYKSNFKVGAASGSIALTEMKIIYKGIKNPIKVSAAGYPIESISVNVTGANATRTGAGMFDIETAGAVNSKVTISVSARDDAGGGRTIVTETYTVKSVPDPILMLGNKKSGSSASLDEIINSPITAQKDPSFVYNATYKVNGFSIMIAVPGGVPVSYNITGDKIANNPQAAAAVRNSVRSGSNFNFSSFNVQTPSGPRSGVPGIAYTIR